MKQLRIGILGVGQMGEAIVMGLKRCSRYTIQGTTHRDGSAQAISEKLGIECHTDNEKLVKTSDVILVCVKPQQVAKVLEPLTPFFKSSQLLISIAASLTNKQLSQLSGGKIAVIRSMPNTPILIGEGMTVLCPPSKLSDEHLKLAQDIFSECGKTAVIDEELMDGATGLSGCGPAYVYLIIEALSEAGVKTGLPRKTATLLAAQTLLGSARMVLDRSEHPAALKDEVTTPAGCTIDGLMALEEGKLRVTLIKAVLAAAKKSQKMRKK